MTDKDIAKLFLPLEGQLTLKESDEKGFYIVNKSDEILVQKCASMEDIDRKMAHYYFKKQSQYAQNPKMIEEIKQTSKRILEKGLSNSCVYQNLQSKTEEVGK